MRGPGPACARRQHGRADFGHRAQRFTDASDDRMPRRSAPAGAAAAATFGSQLHRHRPAARISAEIIGGTAAADTPVPPDRQRRPVSTADGPLDRLRRRLRALLGASRSMVVRLDRRQTLPLYHGAIAARRERSTAGTALRTRLLRNSIIVIIDGVAYQRAWTAIVAVLDALGWPWRGGEGCSDPAALPCATGSTAALPATAMRCSAGRTAARFRPANSGAASIG